MLSTVGATLIMLGMFTSSMLVQVEGTVRGFLRLGLSRTAALISAKALLCLFLLTVAGGCASQQDFLSQIEPAALSAAQNRAQFELNCPNLTTSVLSRKVIEPPPIAVRLGGGMQRAEYTIGVAGCGRRSVYMAICPDASNCNAFAQTGRILDAVN